MAVTGSGKDKQPERKDSTDKDGGELRTGEGETAGGGRSSLFAVVASSTVHPTAARWLPSAVSAGQEENERGKQGGYGASRVFWVEALRDRGRKAGRCEAFKPVPNNYQKWLQPPSNF